MANKKTFIIVLFLVLIVALGIGYAAFSDTLTISGTANANGKFDLEFTSATIVTSQGVTVGSGKTEAIISENKNTLTANVADLAYPGAGVQFRAVITNKGTVPAKVKGLTTESNLTGADSIKITGLDNVISESHGVIQPNGTCTIDFTIEWDKTKELTDSVNGDTVSFELGIEYEQATTDFEGTAGHDDVNP